MVSIYKLIINDMRNIIRDRFLIYACFMGPVAFTIICRLILPWISEKFYDLSMYYDLLYMMFVIFIPMIFGFVIAFLIIDERDENILTVLRVMPISRNGYLLYRLLLLSFFSFLFVAIFPYLTGLIEIDFLNYLPVAFLFCLFTPVLALLVNIIAQNKIQAFAIFKIGGSLFLLPLFAFFIQDNLKYIFGIIPNFWSFMALHSVLTTGTQDFVYLGVGYGFHIVLIGVLLYIFNKKV